MRSKAAPSSGVRGGLVAAGAGHAVRLVPAVSGALMPCGSDDGAAPLQGDRSPEEPCALFDPTDRSGGSRTVAVDAVEAGALEADEMLRRSGSVSPPTVDRACMATRRLRVDGQRLSRMVDGRFVESGCTGTPSACCAGSAPSRSRPAEGSTGSTQLVSRSVPARLAAAQRLLIASLSSNPLGRRRRGNDQPYGAAVRIRAGRLNTPVTLPALRADRSLVVGLAA